MAATDEEDEVALRQTKNLRHFRLLFTIALLIVALGLALGIYFLTRNQEEEAFSATFEDRATKVIDTVHIRVEQKTGALESFSVSLTSYATFNNLTWPFVTVPDYEVKAASVRSLAKSVSLMFYPHVDAEDREAWEAYSGENQAWVQKGRDFQQAVLKEETTDRRLGEETDFVSYIDDEGNRLPVTGDGPFFPSWQSSPVSENLINLDLHSTEIFSRGIHALEESGNAIVGESTDGYALDDGTFGAFRDSWGGQSSRFYDGKGPVSKIYVPIFDQLDTARPQNVVGMVTSVSFWESFMYRILPPDQGNLDVVIKNKCGESFTYLIQGETVSYAGSGDLHDRDFDDMAKTSKIFIQEKDGSKHYHMHLEDVCDYTMTIYPTQDLQDEYISSTPWFFFGLVLAVFIFTTAMIYVYDWRVEKNYQETYKKAKQAGAIVSSIFPAAVRRRLYEDDNSNSNSKVKGQGAFKQAVPMAVDAQKTRLKGFLNEGETMPAEGLQPNNSKEPQKLEKAIADLFPNTTILFADIVGFTAWSSQRYVLLSHRFGGPCL